MNKSVENQTCVYYLAGRCKYGDRCLRRHDPGLRLRILARKNESRQRAQAQIVCYYFKRGRCLKGSDCTFDHGSGVVNDRKPGLVHPSPGSESNVVQESGGNAVERVFPNLTGSCRVEDLVECGVCLEAPERHNRRFGLLEACDHSFCLKCIRTWRASNPAEAENKVQRQCPVCRASSAWVVPSSQFLTGSEKQQALKKYQEHLSSINCMFYERFGACPYRHRCRYTHRKSNGEVIDKELQAVQDQERNEARELQRQMTSIVSQVVGDPGALDDLLDYSERSGDDSSLSRAIDDIVRIYFENVQASEDRNHS
mmetsp:Transcript_17672/g.36677  ORF Transcript_17672/g.36677 Transcript_17672/m.36677 type:complete len:312 (-) Transcript_17672:2282-3217(-)